MFFVFFTVASFLISSRSVSYSIQSMNEAETLRARICVRYGTVTAATVSSFYPDIGLVSIEGETSDKVLEALGEYRCAGAVIPRDDWEFIKNRKDVNPSKLKYP